MILNAYFDESEMNGVLTVGGYAFKQEAIDSIEAEWSSMLERHQLTHFHMTDCNSGKREFTGKNAAQIASEAYALIGKYSAFSSAVSVEIELFKKIVRHNRHLKTAYELCIWYAIAGIAVLRDTDISKTMFTFEAGHQHQVKANRLLTHIFKDERLKQFHKYLSHAFIDKRETACLQAADIAAWHYAKHISRNQTGLVFPRGDFQELANNTKHVHLMLNSEHLRKWSGPVEKPFRS